MSEQDIVAILVKHKAGRSSREIQAAVEIATVASDAAYRNAADMASRYGLFCAALAARAALLQ